MANDHEIEVLNGLVAAILRSAGACGRLAAARPSNAHDLEQRTELLRRRASGLDAQIRALGGQPAEARASGDRPTPIEGSPADEGGTSYARMEAGLVAVFRVALDDRRLGESTRSAIATAWSMIGLQSGGRIREGGAGED